MELSALSLPHGTFVMVVGQQSAQILNSALVGGMVRSIYGAIANVTQEDWTAAVPWVRRGNGDKGGGLEAGEAGDDDAMGEDEKKLSGCGVVVYY